MPSSSTPANAIMATQNSTRDNVHVRRSSRTLTRPFTATSTIAASTTSGRLRNRSVRNRRHTAIAPDANTSESGVRAPALSFTVDCDRPPATG